MGPRKLVRPHLPEEAMRARRYSRHEEPALSQYASGHIAPSGQESSHAESFYFQKQMQTQTPMVFVLDDGEQIEGCIEWYDKHAIKVRAKSSGARGGETRTLLYKSCIKYLYKAGENIS
jgi:sRNA-binding regulator protein Hfq